ncbi:MAG: hypothetical protein ACXWJD_06315 [Burkholderiaceae bacterium]
MQTSLLKKLTLVAIAASACAITGCSDANSKNPVPAQNPTAEAPPTSVTSTQTSEAAKRDAESGNALY